MPELEPLPIVKISPEIDYQQTILIEKLQQYVATRGAKLDYESAEGLCAGLVAAWLYFKRTGSEANFIYKLEHALKWDLKSYLDSKAEQDDIMEMLINMLVFLSFDMFYRHAEKIGQDQINRSFELLLGTPRVAKPEFKSTLVFDHKTLAILISKSIFEQKMVRFSNSKHVVGVMCSEGVYYMFDPSSKDGPRAFLTITALTEALFASLGDSQTAMALNMQAFDLDDVPVEPQKYREAEEYIQQLLADSEYRKSIAAHENFFDVAVKFKDFSLIESFISRQQFDFKSREGITPLGIAVMHGASAMLYKLLAAGADPQQEAMPGFSLWDLALSYRNTDAIIMLLAFGLEVPKQEFANLKRKFSPRNYKAIINATLALNAELFKVSEQLDLRTADPKQISAYLCHMRLKVQLGLGLENANTHNLDTILEHSNVSELNSMLKLIANIVQQITSKSLTEHTDADLLEIASIVDHLTELSAWGFSMNPIKMYLRHKAADAKAEIEQYLARNNTPINNNQYRQLLFFDNPNPISLELPYSAIASRLPRL